MPNETVQSSSHGSQYSSFYYYIHSMENCEYLEMEKNKLNQGIYSSSRDFDMEVQQILTNRFVRMESKVAIRVMQWIMIGFGAIWGVPWMQAAADGFHQIGLVSEFWTILAKIGIVLAVGIEGIWVMVAIHDNLFQRHKTKLKLRSAYNHQVKIIILSCMLAISSCIPSVYASYLFNQGFQRYFAIITLFGNVGLSILGYYFLLFSLCTKFIVSQNEAQTVIYQGKIREMYDTILNNAESQDKSIVKKEITTYQEFTSYLHSQSGNYYRQEMSWCNLTILMVVPIIVASVIAFTQSLIDVVLTAGFFQDKLHWAHSLSYVLAIVFAVPGLVISLISSRDVFSKILLFVMCKNQKNTKHIERFFRKIRILINIISLIVCLGAPSAACYIVYTSISPINVPLATAATISMFIARVCFSNYTSRMLLIKLISRILNRPTSIEEQNLEQIFKLLEKVHPQNYLHLTQGPLDKINKSEH